MKKLNLSTPNLIEENIEKLKSIFPNVIKEEKVDFELLKQMLCDYLIEGCKERYGLNWVGKRRSILKANMPITKTLRPVIDKSVDFDKTKNLYIEGDNFEALKIIQESYLGKIKMIYIDPPYNTGKDFIYKDNFKKSKEDYETEIEAVDEEGVKLFKNTDSNGRFHSDWLSMMYERLLIARDLLREDGVIFISIDDHEVHNLRHLCDEVFGERNFISMISVKVRDSAGESGGGEDKKLKKNVEYLFFYAKNRSCFELKKIYELKPLKQEILIKKLNGKSFGYKDVLLNMHGKKKVGTIKDGTGNDINLFVFEQIEKKTINSLAKEEQKEDYDIYKQYYHQIFTTYNARTSIRDRIKKALPTYEGLIEIEYQPKSGKYKNQTIKKYFWGKTKRLLSWLHEVSILDSKGEIYIKEELGTLWTNVSWAKLANEGNITFNNGKKPVDFIKSQIKLANVKNSDIILDFFSGSATTAHAVMELNAEDGGNRQFIMVQLPELVDEDSEAYKAGFRTIAEIGRERIIRAAKKIKEDFKDKEYIDKLDFGFRYFKVDTSNFKEPRDISEFDQRILIDDVKNIKPDRNDLDLLFEVILNLGLELTLQIESKELEGKKVYFVEKNSLIACFGDGIDEDFAKSLAKFKPLRVVLKDGGFKSDSEKVNFEETFKELNPETEIMVV